MKRMALCFALAGTLLAAERVQPGTPKPRVCPRSQVFLVGGVAADLASSYYVTRRLEARGWRVIEKSPVYGQRFDGRDVAIGAGIVAGVLVVQRLTPGWTHWSKVNWVVGSVRYGVAAHNVAMMR